MIPTPLEVLPIIEPAVPALAAALTIGAEYADVLQPDPLRRDSHYWSHSARFRARNHLVSIPDKIGWTVNAKAPNSGIHICVDAIHTVRVLKTLNDSTPHAGRNQTRQLAWAQSPLLLGTTASGEPFSLLADWHVGAEGPVINIGFPKAPGNYVGGADLYWRVEVTGDPDADLANLSFDPDKPIDGLSVRLKIDPSEFQGQL